MSQSNYRRNVPQNTPPEVIHEHRLKQLHMLLGSLMYNGDPGEESDKIYHMGTHSITPKMLPQSLPFERRLLECIDLCSSDGEPPTPGALTMKMAARYSLDPQKVAEKLQEIMAQRPPAHFGITVEMMAYGLRREWLDTYRMEKALTNAISQVTTPIGNVEDRMREAIATVMKSVPNAQYITVRRAAESIAAWRQYQQDIEDRHQRGQLSGPTFPWKGMSDYIVALQKTNMCAITGTMGSGKSTVGAVLAEHWAYNPKQGYYVLHIRTETGDNDWVNRKIARRGHVPTYLLKKGVNIVLPPDWRKKVEDALAWYEEKERSGPGVLVDSFAPGLTPTDLEMLVLQHKAIAEASGLELCVLIDYFQNMDWKEFNATDEVKGLTRLAQWLKQFAAKHRIYLVVFAQGDPHADKKDKMKRGQTRGTRELEIASQLVLAIEREEAKDNMLIDDPARPGQPLMDPQGKEILLERKGDYGATGKIWIRKANDDMKFVAVPVTFVNPFFNVVSHETTGPGSTILKIS